MFDQFFSFYGVQQTSRNNLEGSTRSSGIYCESNKITSSGPKKLIKTQISEKKAIFPVKEKILPTFSRIIDHDKCQETKFEGLQCVLTSTLQAI